MSGSVTERINTLNQKLNVLLDFVDNVATMRKLQKSCIGQPVTGLKDVENIVDDFLAKRSE